MQQQRPDLLRYVLYGWVWLACLVSFGTIAVACREMLVQWTTRDVGRPLVKIGTEPGRLDQVLEAYESVTYSREEMCGPPASTVGYVHPGMMHRALLQDLKPDTRYFYQYGAEVMLP